MVAKIKGWKKIDDRTWESEKRQIFIHEFQGMEVLQIWFQGTMSRSLNFDSLSDAKKYAIEYMRLHPNG